MVYFYNINTCLLFLFHHQSQHNFLSGWTAQVFMIPSHICFLLLLLLNALHCLATYSPDFDRLLHLQSLYPHDHANFSILESSFQQSHINAFFVTSLTPPLFFLSPSFGELAQIGCSIYTETSCSHDSFFPNSYSKNQQVLSPFLQECLFGYVVWHVSMLRKTHLKKTLLHSHYSIFCSLSKVLII